MKYVVYFCTAIFSVFLIAGCKTAPKEIPEDLSSQELIHLAQTSYDDGNVKAAMAYYEAIIIRYGDDMSTLVEAEYEIAHLKVKKEQWQEAIPDLQRILSYYENDMTGTLPPAFKRLAQNDWKKIPENELVKAGVIQATE